MDALGFYSFLCSSLCSCFSPIVRSSLHNNVEVQMMHQKPWIDLLPHPLGLHNLYQQTH
uniref:Uncharacterized protein LOC105107600 n=1 Tax=Rhizophora mucronata TaxID=61149 RepID=A0A2P2JEN2_RHIMU